MDLEVHGASLRGSVDIPGSKSHTIRAVAFAGLAEGESVITQPLDSFDAQAACVAYRAFGADIEQHPAEWRVKGTGGNLKTPDNIVDVLNSGTTMNIALGSAALLLEGIAVLSGDEQVRRRPCGPLIQSLNDLGANVRSTRGTGTPPVVVEGRLQGGSTTLEAKNSQYLSSLLMNCPLAEGDSHIKLSLLYEQPYVHMTLDWLKRLGIKVEHAEDLSEFYIPGGQSYTAGNWRIQGDFSSATFFLAAGALADNDIVSIGLDMNDTQGDKAVVEYLRQMGAEVTVEADRIHVRGRGLQGCELDLNATPDALPMMAVAACFAQGETRLVNVPQARLKETDRITVMCQELKKMGADIEELPDGLVVRESKLSPATVEGHGDHRVVMSLAVAASMLDGVTRIKGCKAVGVTFPGFVDALNALGGDARVVE